MQTLDRLRDTERALARVRILALAIAVLTVGAIQETYPHGYRPWAYAITGAFAAGAAGLYWLSRRELGLREQRALALGALLFDTAIVFAYVLVYSFEPGLPSRSLLYLTVVEAALRFGVVGGVALPLATAPALALIEWFREDRFAPSRYDLNNVLLPVGIQVILGVIVGRLVVSLRAETALADSRAEEAVALRDELGRRADLLDAANRCARALGSSLELEPAFSAFVRELRGLLPFDRAALVLVDGGAMRVMAAAGVGVHEVLVPGTALPNGALIEQVVERGEAMYRPDMPGDGFPEEEELARVGLRSRVVAPLLLGARAIGMVSVLRTERDAFTSSEIELVTLLGRLLATAVQNIRNYEGEHRSVEELRRLSTLRADFVSLVSHELRSPMAAVIGAARTLQLRWRDLSPEQRESFLSLIAEETSRLATLVGDVLDTSRIEAGTFSFSFGDVDLGELMRETAAGAELGQDEVSVRATVEAGLPSVRGDRERLKQVLTNLVENAVKYSPTGGTVAVAAYASSDARVRVDVRDDGPGIAPEQQAMIFEKFGRAKDGNSQPGSGLGLFIARSIAEAHGGSLDVRSSAGRGATFTVALPVDSAPLRSS